MAFIKKNPTDGWDCVIVAPKRGEFFVYKTMFGQKKKPYQNNKLIRHTASVRQGNAADVLIRGGLMSIHDVPETVGIKPNCVAGVNTQSEKTRYSIAADSAYMQAHTEDNEEQMRSLLESI